ncbi:MAG: serine hydrolase domain-containing protein [Myxococcota bacterium]
MWDSLALILDNAIESQTVPGLGLSIKIGEDTLFSKVLGNAQITPTPNQIKDDTLWDLASLTKVLCTAPLMLALHDKSQIDLFKPLPEYDHAFSPADLLSHSSGLPAWKAFYAPYLLTQSHWKDARYRESIEKVAEQTLQMNQSGTSHCYSDIGYIILGKLITTVTGLSLDQAWLKYLPESATNGLTWGASNAHSVASTEQCPLRGRVICGEVHDLNAAAMGGVAPHAGLFGSLSATARAAHWPLDVLHGRSKEIKAQSLHTFWNTKGSGSHLLGWDTPSGPNSSASEKWPSTGIGHLAFTGCSIWMIPEKDLSVTFVSNRIHPNAYGGVMGGFQNPKYIAFRALRQEIHREIMKILA